VGTRGTARYLRERGITIRAINKLSEGRPHVVDYLKNGEIHLLINTSLGRKSSYDGLTIRRSAILYNIPYATTMAGARAMVEAITALKREPFTVRSLQEYHARP